MADADPGGFAQMSDEDEPSQDGPDATASEWVGVEWAGTGELDDELDDDCDDEADDDDEGGISFEYEATIPPGDPAMRELLERGEIDVLGLMPWSSNGTYLVQVRRGEDQAPAIYKPERGERPLWDFPGALWKREVATYELSDSLGFDLVPTTVARVSAPIGRGSVQAFVPARFAEHYFTIRERPELGATLRTLCAFDLIANSADRKGGHCLIDDDDRIWAIDNGLTFHEEFKVRTVLWDFSGEAIPADVAAAVSRLLDEGLSDRLVALLTDTEQQAVLDRARAVLAGGHFPHDPTGRRYPWPLV